MLNRITGMVWWKSCRFLFRTAVHVVINKTRANGKFKATPAPEQIHTDDGYTATARLCIIPTAALCRLVSYSQACCFCPCVSRTHARGRRCFLPQHQDSLFYFGQRSDTSPPVPVPRAWLHISVASVTRCITLSIPPIHSLSMFLTGHL